MANKEPPTQKVSDVISAFRPTRRFKPDDPKAHVTSLDFDDSGELAIVARTDDTLQIYNCKEGKHAKELKSQKYGVHLARFTHHAQSILYASTKVDDTIRYLSTHDNSYIRYYRGHVAPVTSIALCPSNDTFLSCSLDHTVRIWSLSSPNHTGVLKLHAPYLASYDPSASVIAIASPPTQSILLYDLRNFDKPPFQTFDLQPYESRLNPSGLTARRRGESNWTKIEFSNDGKHMLIGTAGDGHYVLDAFDGDLKHYCVRHNESFASSRRAPGSSSSAPVGQGDVCFSPDGRYLVGGSGTDGTMLVWDIETESSDDKVLAACAQLPALGRHEIVGYNPRTNMLCSADRDVVMWLPDPELVS
ncbi:WD repeat-containing protein 82 [Rhizodiscina lignyota]|uniref:WD repeat-containing protein 82 n=1 Tax=Rhizodiscina lignyota TaxID=1504668 RepID=A0A9P4MBV4_9PEZI|nr:WD repeat-containing protein 82 [Rhizodiscina lignyota]